MFGFAGQAILTSNANIAQNRRHQSHMVYDLDRSAVRNCALQTTGISGIPSDVSGLQDGLEPLFLRFNRCAVKPIPGIEAAGTCSAAGNFHMRIIEGVLVPYFEVEFWSFGFVQ